MSLKNESIRSLLLDDYNALSWLIFVSLCLYWIVRKCNLYVLSWETRARHFVCWVVKMHAIVTYSTWLLITWIHIGKNINQIREFTEYQTNLWSQFSNANWCENYSKNCGGSVGGGDGCHACKKVKRTTCSTLNKMELIIPSPRKKEKNEFEQNQGRWDWCGRCNCVEVVKRSL